MTFLEAMDDVIKNENENTLELLAKKNNVAYHIPFLREAPKNIANAIDGVYLTFLDNIPDMNKNEIARELFEKLFIYFSKTIEEDLNKSTRQIYRNKLDIKDNFEKGTISIYSAEKKMRSSGESMKKDLETAKAFREMITRLDMRAPYCCNAISDMTFEISRDVTFDDLNTTRKVVTALIQDLEKKEFKLIHRQSYYETHPPSKTPIKKFFLSIIKKYNIRAGEFHSKQFIDSI